MKKVYITLIMAVIAVSAVAQNRPVQERGFMGANPANLAPQFTAEQQESIYKLKLELKAELLQIDNQFAEKKAQLKSLQQVEKPNMRAINSKIDEISDLQNKKMKLVAQNQVKVRELLTAEQRLQYDLRMNSGRRGGNRGTMNSRGSMNYKGSMNNRGAVNNRGNFNRGNVNYQRGTMDYRGIMNYGRDTTKAKEIMKNRAKIN